MRFLIKPKQNPKLGDTRVKSRFVFYKRIGNEIRIFEKASWKEELKHCYIHMEGINSLIDSSEWRAIEWIN